MWMSGTLQVEIDRMDTQGKLQHWRNHKSASWHTLPKVLLPSQRKNTSTRDKNIFFSLFCAMSTIEISYTLSATFSLFVFTLVLTVIKKRHIKPQETQRQKKRVSMRTWETARLRGKGAVLHLKPSRDQLYKLLQQCPSSLWTSQINVEACVCVCTVCAHVEGARENGWNKRSSSKW